MKVTNLQNLPQPIVNTLLNRTKAYSKGGARKSITELIGPPRISTLQARHWDEIEVDITRRFWALMGTLLHEIMERAGSAEYLTEERLETKVLGWRVSGGIDVQELSTPEGANAPHVIISDYKFTSAWVVMNDKPEWEAQLNCYRLLVERAKIFSVKELYVTAFVRDWREAEIERTDGYPQAPIVRLPIKMWPLEDTEKYLFDRVSLHQEANRAAEWGEELPECTDEERWMRDTSWAVWKKGNKNPSRTFPNMDEATIYRSEQTLKHPKDEYTIEHRPGRPIRCAENYCMVAPWCSQWAREESKHT